VSDEERVSCRRCGEEKARGAFYTMSYTSAARQPCKECLTTEKRERYAATGGSRVSHAQVLREKYGLTPAQYQEMHDAQRGLCAICGQAETRRGSGGKPRRLSVDRDHRTGVVRQLLCGRCNTVTSAVEERPQLLDAVRAYLLRHGGPGRPREISGESF
jgi:hypothetical protein